MYYLNLHNSFTFLAKMKIMKKIILGAMLCGGFLLMGTHINAQSIDKGKTYAEARAKFEQQKTTKLTAEKAKLSLVKNKLESVQRNAKMESELQEVTARIKKIDKYLNK